MKNYDLTIMGIFSIILYFIKFSDSKNLNKNFTFINESLDDASILLNNSKILQNVRYISKKITLKI